MRRSSARPHDDVPDLLPGQWIRRLQQIAVAIFLDEAQSHGLTPVQFAALKAVCEHPGIDQRTLARTIGLDTSTTAGVVDRLEARGLLARRPTPADRRVRCLWPTDSGAALLREALPGVLRAQARILAPLPSRERAAFLRMLRRLVIANNGQSRAPRDP